MKVVELMNIEAQEMRASVLPKNSFLIGGSVMEMVFNLKKVKIPKVVSTERCWQRRPDL